MSDFAKLVDIEDTLNATPSQFHSHKDSSSTCNTCVRFSKDFFLIYSAILWLQISVTYHLKYIRDFIRHQSFGDYSTHGGMNVREIFRALHIPKYTVGDIIKTFKNEGKPGSQKTNARSCNQLIPLLNHQPTLICTHPGGWKSVLDPQQLSIFESWRPRRGRSLTRKPFIFERHQINRRTWCRNR